MTYTPFSLEEFDEILMIYLWLKVFRFETNLDDYFFDYSFWRFCPCKFGLLFFILHELHSDVDLNNVPDCSSFQNMHKSVSLAVFRNIIQIPRVSFYLLIHSMLNKDKIIQGSLRWDFRTQFLYFIMGVARSFLPRDLRSCISWLIDRYLTVRYRNYHVWFHPWSQFQADDNEN